MKYNQENFIKDNNKICDGMSEICELLAQYIEMKDNMRKRGRKAQQARKFRAYSKIFKRFKHEKRIKK